MILKKLNFREFQCEMTLKSQWKNFPDIKNLLITAGNLYEKSKYILLESRGEVLAFCIWDNGKIEFYEENKKHLGYRKILFRLLDKKA